MRSALPQTLSHIIELLICILHNNKICKNSYSDIDMNIFSGLRLINK